MKIVSIDGTLGTVEIGGIRRKADLSMVDNVKTGDYVVIHAGFAISVMNEEEAMSTLDLFEEIAKKGEELDRQ